MNPYTAIVTQRHLEQLRADAAAHRLARAVRSARSRRSQPAATPTSFEPTSSKSPASVAHA